MRRVVPVVCALALLLAACGGDGDSTASTAASDASQEGGSSDTQPSPDPTEATGGDSDSSGGGDTSGLPPGGTGMVTIDGETIESQWVGNCIIDEVFDPHPDDLDLVAALGRGSSALFLEVRFEELSDGMLMRFIPELQVLNDDGSYSSYAPEGQYMLAPDGNWYQDADGGLYIALFSGQPHENPAVDAPVVVEAGSITGSLPMISDSGTADVAFDLTYVDAIDCSL